jgi:hypothetical protein
MKLLLLSQCVAVLLALTPFARAEVTCPPPPVSNSPPYSGGWRTESDNAQALSTLETLWPRVASSCSGEAIPLRDFSAARTHVTICTFQSQTVAGRNWRITFMFDDFHYQMIAFLPLGGAPLALTSCGQVVNM